MPIICNHTEPTTNSKTDLTFTVDFKTDGTGRRKEFFRCLTPRANEADVQSATAELRQCFDHVVTHDNDAESLYANHMTNGRTKPEVASSALGTMLGLATAYHAREEDRCKYRLLPKC